MFIVHKKGLAMDGTNPTLLYAYGGFNISLTPSFSASNIAFLERGGIYAMPNLRGGGEFGKPGTRRACSWTSKTSSTISLRPAITSWNRDTPRTTSSPLPGAATADCWSGAIMTQRPDFARVALPAVGVMDMLRYHKFTIGWGWI